MRLAVTFKCAPTTPISVAFDYDPMDLDLKFGEIQEVVVNAKPYEGEYVVTPTVAGEVLPTENALMAQDLVIEAIPYHEVKNNASGTTVTIG